MISKSGSTYTGRLVCHDSRHGSCPLIIHRGFVYVGKRGGEIEAGLQREVAGTENPTPTVSVLLGGFTVD